MRISPKPRKSPQTWFTRPTSADDPVGCSPAMSDCSTTASGIINMNSNSNARKTVPKFVAVSLKAARIQAPGSIGSLPGSILPSLSTRTTSLPGLSDVSSPDRDSAPTGSRRSAPETAGSSTIPIRRPTRLAGSHPSIPSVQTRAEGSIFPASRARLRSS